MRDTIAHRGPDGGGTWVSADGRVGPRLPPARDHRPLADAPISRWRTRTARSSSSSTARSTTTPRSARELEATRRAPLADRPLRHRGHRPRVRGVGHRLPPALPRHVRLRALGRARRASSGSSATGSASSRSTTASTTAGSSFASEIKALLARPAAGARGRRGGALPLPLVPDDPGAATRCSRASSKLAGGTWLRVDGDGAIREQRYWDAWDDVDAARRRLRRRDRRARARRAADVGQAAQGQRRAGRRVPLRRHRLEHERRALLRGRGRARSRRSPSATRASTRATRTSSHYARAMAERVGAEHHERLLTHRRPARLPAADGPAAGRADRRSRLRARLLRLEARARQRRHRRAGRRGRRRAVLRLSVVEDVAATSSATTTCRCRACSSGSALRRACGCAGRRPARAYECAPPRRRRPAGLLGRRRGVHRAREAAAALAAAAARVRRPHLVGRARADPRSASRTKAWEPSHLHWMTLPRPEPPAARAAADARRQDEHGRQPRRPRPVPRPQVRRARAEHPDDVKTTNGELKHILKKAVRGVIPDELIDRPKQGFGVPVYEWFFDRLGDARAGARRVLRADGLPRPRRGDRVLDEPRGRSGTCSTSRSGGERTSRPDQPSRRSRTE